MQITKWSEAKFSQNEVKINVLVDDKNGKEIQIALAKDALMAAHKAPFAIRVQVLSGEIDFEVEGQTHRLKALDMISLEPDIIHSLKGLEDSIIRLSLAKKDTVARVNAVLKKP